MTTVKKNDRWLMGLIGVDYNLMKGSGSEVRNNFYGAALALVMISILSFLSVRNAMNMLFQMFYVEISLSVFFSMLFMLIYVFLLNTFSKQPLTGTKSKWSFSNLSRFGFVLFMGFLISKPVELFVFENYADHRVAQYRTSLVTAYEAKLDALYQKDIARLASREQYYISQNRIHPSALLSKEIEQIDLAMQTMRLKKQKEIENVQFTIAVSDFFIYRVQLMTTHPGAWLICCMIMCLFITPGILVYSISADDKYYQSKKEIERELILNHYYIFRRQYQLMFYERYKVITAHYSAYRDPPFNSEKIVATVSRNQKEFLSQFMPDH